MGTSAGGRWQESSALTEARRILGSSRVRRPGHIDEAVAKLEALRRDTGKAISGLRRMKRTANRMGEASGLTTRQLIRKFVRSRGVAEARAIARFCEGYNRTGVYSILGQMVKDEEIKRFGRGRYRP